MPIVRSFLILTEGLFEANTGLDAQGLTAKNFKLTDSSWQATK
jgi:hypothetical protein